ncbi:MAG: hypothetical protein OEO79_14800 [Gemmatimonadota bacterium]|nr:hypothetical protein [Gemmatimonadota bacterium]
MSVRFRIRTSQGQEISFASHEMFAEFVRSGDLSPDDVVYDAETREWSSALTHPVVLQIELDSEDAAEEVSSPPEAGVDQADADTGPDVQSAPDIGLQLAPALDQLTPAQEAAAFVKKMEAERASARHFDDEPPMRGFRMEQGSSGLIGDVVRAPEEPAPTRPEPGPPEPRKGSRHEPVRREAPARKDTKVKPPKKKKRRKKSGAGRKNAPLLIVAAVVVAGVVYFGPELLAPPTGGGSAVGGGTVELPPLPPPLIPDTEDALRARAQERYLATTRSLLRDLPPIPTIWLQGAYLAAPSEYPQVREVWNLYLTTVRQARAGDNERYRAGYLRALDDARVDGTARTLRLAGAVSAFQGEVGPRAAHYDRVEALITAALRGHDALVEAEGSISYEPASGTPVSGDPVIEAVGRNSAAQSLLDQVLDMILGELNDPEGPGRTESVGEWIREGILDAVTR